MKKVLIWVGVAVAVGLVGIVAWGLSNGEQVKEALLRAAFYFGPDVEQQYRDKVARSMEHLRQIRPRLMEDVALAERAGLYPLPPATRIRERDAGTLLNSALHWNGLRSFGYEAAERAPESDLLAIETELDVRALSLKPTISSAEHEQLRALAATLDFSWLEKLHDYDYWSLDRYSPIDRMETHLEDVDLSGWLSPNLEVLEQWVYLATIAAISGDTPPPHRAFRKLARLLLTTEYSPEMRCMLEALSWERRMYDELVHRNVEVEADWHPLSFEEIDRLEAAMSMTSAVLRFASENDAMRVFRDTRPFQCMALNDPALRSFVTQRPIKEQAVPEAYQGLNEALEVAAHCQVRLLRAVWNNDAYLRARMEKVDMFETVGEHKKSDSPVTIFDLADSPTASRHTAFVLLQFSRFPPRALSRYD